MSARISNPDLGSVPTGTPVIVESAEDQIINKVEDQLVGDQLTGMDKFRPIQEIVDIWMAQPRITGAYPMKR